MTDVEITECGRTLGGGLVAFDIQWDGSLSGDVQWVVRITSADRTETVALTVSSEDRQYVECDGRQVDVDPDADLSEGEITARFPEDVVGVAIEWPTWTAAVSVDGQVVAEHVIPTG
jgi:hypothetical protein